MINVESLFKGNKDLHTFRNGRGKMAASSPLRLSIFLNVGYVDNT